MGLSGRGVDVFGLGQPGKLIFVARKAAEKDAASQHQDGSAPAEAVRPRVVVITFIDLLVELDWVDDQSDYLHNYCKERQQNYSVAQQIHNQTNCTIFSSVPVTLKVFGHSSHTCLNAIILQNTKAGGMYWTESTSTLLGFK